MKYYVMYAETCVEDYVCPDDTLDVCERACYKSELQFFDKQPITVGISDEGGIEFTDLIIKNDCIPLFSRHLRQVLDEANIDYIAYRPVTLSYDRLGICEEYYLALIPRIRCLDLDRSKICIEENNDLRYDQLMKEVEHIVINANNVGRFEIFKLPMEYENQEIIVSERLMNKILTRRLKNIIFSELDQG
ncbi:MAG: hypothetical protein IJU76_15360 [Desulfovibrionaceae bacterium]|nr:hypothetical protein [Desulfovibrionaceae bacterium]